MTFTGKFVVITGAAGGIGSVLTKRFFSLGARVYAADLKRDALDRLKGECDAPEALFTATFDISDEAGCQEFAHRVHEEWGALDVLVNAAGYFPLTPFEELTYARWREIIAINLDGPFLVTRALLPLLKASRAGQALLCGGDHGCFTSVAARKFVLLGERKEFHRLEDVVGCKWSVGVIAAIRDGVRRPRALERYLPGISKKVLRERLRKLTNFRLITARRLEASVPGLEYDLTEDGEKLAQILDQLRGLEQQRGVPPGER